MKQIVRLAGVHFALLGVYGGKGMDKQNTFSLTEQVCSRVARMSVKEKVGQLFLLAFAKHRLEDIRTMIETYFIGGCYISDENAATPTEALRLSRNLQSFATATPSGLPLLLAVDHEGTWAVLTNHFETGPGNLALGKADSPNLTRRIYAMFADELLAVGYNTLLAPCADVNSNPKNPIIGMRSFGENPLLVASHVSAAVRGAGCRGVITTAKHFPGHGDTDFDSHRLLAKLEKSREELEAFELVPFKAAIDAGVDIIMTSHILYPSIDKVNPATCSSAILKKLLRDEMGFKGVILSDSLNMGAIKQTFSLEEAAIASLLAGVDMIMLAEERYNHSENTYLEKQRKMISAVVSAVQEGKVPMDILDAAVSRIVRLKLTIRMPLMGSEKSLDSIGSLRSKRLVRSAAKKALRLIRDRGGLFPVKRSMPIVLINPVPQAYYARLSDTRGIGPNQTISAFSVFWETLVSLRGDISVYNFETLREIDNRSFEGLIMIVDEDYTLPGMNFDEGVERDTISRLVTLYGEKVMIIALRSPYDIDAYPQAGTILCSFSSRPCAAVAAAKAVVGRIKIRGGSRSV